MASIAKDPNGRRRILFVAPNGSRKTIRLGKVSQRVAEGFKLRIEQLLEALRFNRAFEAELVQWVTDLDPTLAEKLARVELIPPIAAKPNKSLGAFLEAWLASRKGDYKPASLIAWGQVVKVLKNFFGAECPLDAVTPAKRKRYDKRWFRLACVPRRFTNDCSTRECFLPMPSERVS